MKVLVISNYRNTVSVRPEAEMFIGLQQAGVEVEVMTFGDSEYAENFRKAGIRVIDFHPVKKFSFKEIKKIRQTLKKGGHDILHVFNTPAIINGLFAVRGLPVKLVLYRGFTGHVKWYDPTMYVKYLSPRVDKIICVSESVKHDLDQQLVFGGKQKPIVIHKGHAPEWYQGVESTDVHTKLNLPKGAFTITCVANVRPMKGIPYLLEAFHQLPKEIPIHLLLIGDGMDAPVFKDLMDQNTNRDKIHVLGYQIKPLELVAGSDAFVLASTHGEGLSKVVIEAMSLGVPPIVTSILANKALVIDQKSGLKVPPADPKAIAEAMLALYHNPKLREELSQGAKAHIEKDFHVLKSVEETLVMYQSLTK